MKTAWRQQRTDRFRILHRDQFACRYCGCRPGCDSLEVDHLVPRSRGGSDDAANLVAACKTCNSRKSDTIFFPHDLIERIDEEEYQALVRDAEDKQRRYARAEGGMEQIKKELHDQFGCDTVEEADEMIADLERKERKLTAEARRLMDEYKALENGRLETGDE